MNYRRLMLWSVLLSLIAAWPAHHALAEEQTADQGQKLVEEATRHFASGRFDKSKNLLLEAKSSTQNPGLLARVHLLLGLNELIGGNRSQAEQSFETALSYDAEIDLDPNRFKPEFVEVFRRVRGRASGEIHVSADDRTVVVIIDGQKQGPVPLTKKFGIGTHVAEIRSASGELLLNKKLVLRSGERKELAVVVPRTTLVAEPVLRDADTKPTLHARSRKWTWVAAAGTAVALGLAIGFSAAAYSNHGDGCNVVDPQGARDCKPDPAGTISSTDAARYESLRDSLDRNRLIANISWGVAGALAVTTGIAFWLERPRAEKRAPEKSTLRFWAPPSAQLGIGVGASY